MALHHVVNRRIAEGVELDSVYDVLVAEPLGWRRDAVRLDGPQVKLHGMVKRRIADQHGECFAVGRLGHSHRAEFCSQVDGQ